MTLIPLSRLLIEGHSDTHTFAFRNGRPIPFDRFRADVAHAAAKFKMCGRATLVCQDTYNFAVGFYGLLHAGANIILPSSIQPGPLQVLKEESDLVVDDSVIESGHHEALELAPIDPARLSLLFYTSGSTGEPKAISKNVEMLEHEAAMLDSLWGEKSKQGPVFSTVSHKHVYGMTFKLIWPLMARRPFVAETHTLWELLLAELAPDAVIVSSPAHLERLDGIEPLPPRRRPERIFSAGAPLSWDASLQTEAIFGCRPTEIFGSTETGAFATRRRIRDDEPWHLLPGVSMRPEHDGRLTLRSPSIGPDWFTTADLVEPLADGFRSLGRADRMAKIECRSISLAEVEQVLTRISFVKFAAAVMLHGKPNRLAAVIVPSEEGRLMLDKIGNFRFGRLLRKNLASVQEPAGIPRLWRFVNELPTQALGKRRDADICALFGNDP
jgi:acyl-coenzyme A synthetase/AMP-(fatty) acid ligase